MLQESLEHEILGLLFALFVEPPFGPPASLLTAMLFVFRLRALLSSRRRARKRPIPLETYQVYLDLFQSLYLVGIRSRERTTEMHPNMGRIAKFITRIEQYLHTRIKFRATKVLFTQEHSQLLYDFNTEVIKIARRYRTSRKEGLFSPHLLDLASNISDNGESFMDFSISDSKFDHLDHTKSELK